jgi:hypothetical protein
MIGPPPPTCCAVRMLIFVFHQSSHDYARYILMIFRVNVRRFLRASAHWRYVSSSSAASLKLAKDNTRTLRVLCEDVIRSESKTLAHFYTLDLKTIYATLPTLYDIIKTEYEGRVDAAMKDAFPEHNWHPWLFQERVPFGFWNDVSHRKSFFDWYAKEVLKKDPEDAETWYNVTSGDLIQHGAGFMLSRFYKESVIEAVTSLYHPKGGWLIWRFPRLPAVRIFLMIYFHYFHYLNVINGFICCAGMVE